MVLSVPFLSLVLYTGDLYVGLRGMSLLLAGLSRIYGKMKLDKKIPLIAKLEKSEREVQLVIGI